MRAPKHMRVARRILDDDCKKNLLRLSILILLALVIFSSTQLASVAAVPPLPSEFYGSVFYLGQAVAPSSLIKLSVNGTFCSSDFRVQNAGYFGLVTCKLDDPETTAVEGAQQGQAVEAFLNGEPLVLIEGDNLTASQTFKFLNLSGPVPYCGDLFCDPFFESIGDCPEDCTTNVTGNETNETSGTGGTESGGGGTSGGSSSGSGGAAGAGGGASGAGGTAGGGGASTGAAASGSAAASAFGALTGFLSPISGLFMSSGLCQEDWECGNWTDCRPDGTQIRVCADLNHCNTFDYKPPEVQECIYEPSCFNGIQDFEETGVDCGGPCKPCPSCSNGIQDCYTLEDGSEICETGIDCGGPCRPCDSCFNGEQDWTETGVDCGGLYCDACEVRPILEYPKIVCEKSINPFTNAGMWFLLLLLILCAVRVYFYLDRIERIHNDNTTDEYKRARAYFAERRKMILFVLIVLAVAFLSYLFYYEFLLCALRYGQLWWLLLLVLLTPLIIYEIWRFMEYKDKQRLRGLGALSREHGEAMMRMLDFENQQILAIEHRVKELIEKVARDPKLHDTLAKSENLKIIYRDCIRLFGEYEKNKSPYGVEKELCDQVYAIETNEEFKNLAEQHPDIWLLYEQLKLLYQHYESKQSLYDEIEQERERIQQHLAETSMSGAGGEGGKGGEGGEDDKAEEGDGGTEGADAAGGSEEKKT